MATGDKSSALSFQDGIQQSQLTAEQLARCEKNRLEALSRRQAALERQRLAQTDQPTISSFQRFEDGPTTPQKRIRVLPGSILKNVRDPNLPPSYAPKPLPFLPDKGSKQPSSQAPTSVLLSEEQMQVLKSLSERKSVFLTGCAGTGKSFVLESAIRQLRSLHGEEFVYVTASTGLAACALSGTTLHSFAGVGLAQGSRESLVEKAKMRREVRARWQGAQALVIDEVSMVDAEFFETLDLIARRLRNSPEPFGGIQLLVTGDFFQLPPVNRESNDKSYAFDAQCWDSCFDLQMELTHVFRQSDQSFVQMLNEIREGVVSPLTREKLFSRLHNFPATSDGIMLTKLYPYKVDVARENSQRLQELKEHEMVYHAKDEGFTDHARKQLEYTRAEKQLSVRRGAQVMLIKNLDCLQGLVNGARGVVVGFCDPNHPSASQFRHLAESINPSGMWPVVRFACDQSERIMGPENWEVEEHGKAIAKRWQVPLTLAWALSVHKCQGMTLDRVETDLQRAFDYGMVYVALSRVRSLEGLHLIGFDPNRVKVHPKVAEFYKKLHG